MNNLHRELAPISDSAWAQIEEETSRTLKRYLAGRRVVDVKVQPASPSQASAPVTRIQSPPQQKALSRASARSRRWSNCVFPSNWIAKVSTMLIAVRMTPTGNQRRTPRDRSPSPRTPPYSTGMPPPALEASDRGPAIHQDASRRRSRVSRCHRSKPEPVASRRCQWSLLGAPRRRRLHRTRRNQRPRLPSVGARQAPGQRSNHLGPAITGAFVLTTRGGDFDLHIGQDVSIGYLNHNDAAVRLYLQETFTFLLLTTEAAVALVPPAKAKKVYRWLDRNRSRCTSIELKKLSL